MHPNIIRLKAVNGVLTQLNEEFVFVGGAVVSLYTDYVQDDNVRPTDDVDVIVELAGYHGYASLDEKLRSIGFKNDTMSGVICRYLLQGIIVDIMPTDPSILGFSNRWYPDGFKNAVAHQIDKGSSLKIFPLPYFIASKWEAYKGRGKDYRLSTDFEDLVFLFENVKDLDQKVRNCPNDLFTYLQTEFANIIDSRDFEEGLTANLSRENRDIDENYIINLLRSALSIDPPYRGFSR